MQTFPLVVEVIDKLYANLPKHTLANQVHFWSNSLVYVVRIISRQPATCS